MGMMYVIDCSLVLMMYFLELFGSSNSGRYTAMRSFKRAKSKPSERKNIS
jgi:hypothetical protein